MAGQGPEASRAPFEDAPTTPTHSAPSSRRPTLGHIRISEQPSLTLVPSNTTSSPRCASASSRRSASPAPVACRIAAQLGPQHGLAAGVDPSSLGQPAATGSMSPTGQRSPARNRSPSPPLKQPTIIESRARGGSNGSATLTRQRSPETPLTPPTTTATATNKHPSARRPSQHQPAATGRHSRSVSAASPPISDASAPTIALSSVIAARPAPLLGGPGPTMPSTPAGVPINLSSGTASPLIGGSPSGPGSASPVIPTGTWATTAMGISRPGSPNGIGSPKSSVVGVGSRSPSPTPRDDVIEGMSASTTSIFERDVEHADPLSLPLTASDAVDLAIPPVLDEAVVTMLSPMPSPSGPHSSGPATLAPPPPPSSATLKPPDPNIVTADSADPSSLIIEPLSAILTTGGVSASHPSGGWTSGPAAAAVAMGGIPTHPSTTASANPSPRVPSGVWGPTLSAIGGPQPPASPPLSETGASFPPSSPVLGRGRNPQKRTTPASPPPSDTGDTTLTTPAKLTALTSPTGTGTGGESSPPLSVASYPMSSSLSDPSSPRSLSPTGSTHGLDRKVLAGENVGGANNNSGGKSLALGGLALGPPPPSHQPMGGGVAGLGGVIGAGGASGGSPGASRRLSFLSYADLINAERVEAAEREASGLGTGGVSGGGGSGAGGAGWQGFGDVGEVPGLLWAALGDHQAGQQGGLFAGGKGGGEDEEEVLRGAGPVPSEDERTGPRW